MSDRTQVSKDDCSMCLGSGVIEKRVPSATDPRDNYYRTCTACNGTGVAQ